MMPSFHGSAVDASKAGLRVLKCHHCDGWVWWPPEHDLTEETRRAGRVFHAHGPCERAERAMRDAERLTDNP